ncbi:uncharacterized protein LOC121635392 [Melanotaenia boesemani]|uniref:uncharacterized protein LOC121635392 n=1 Tax=Melanotaenia boesemani TaxID=1250792 RepID=UPI001C03EA88|nr:uncharacterized protein LOC121635392 [Melanotaenia boesemani]
MLASTMESSRTVIVSGVPNVLSASRMVDKLTIHFQSGRRSGGGDVEGVTYPTSLDGVAFVTFDRAEDAEKVLKKEQHILMDDEFKENYLLTVFPFSKDVFLYIPSATVDLSMFGSDQASLIDSLLSAHRSIRFKSLPQDRKAIIEGPFSAVKALREDLIQRASRLQPSAQSPAVRHSSRTKTKQEPASQKSSDEPRKVQKPKNQRVSPEQRVSDESLTGGSFSDENEKDLDAQSGRDISTKHGQKKTVRQVVGKEAIARAVSSQSSQYLHPEEETSPKQLRDDHFLENHSRSGKISAAKAREEEDSGSRFANTDYWKELSSYKPKLNYSVDTEGLHPRDLEDIWVDLYTFKYIQNFHEKELDRCFKGLSINMSKCVAGSGLMQLSLTEKHPTKAALRVLEAALEDLETLMDFWQSHLRVHKIFTSKAEKQKLTRICKEAVSRFNDVLCIFEDSCIKIIGPSENSYRFYETVKDRMASMSIP